MKRSTKIRIRHRGAAMLFYPAALPLSRQTLYYTAGIIRCYRRAIGSCWRKLNPGRQALLVLACLRTGERFAELAAGFGIGTATAWLYVNETVGMRQPVHDKSAIRFTRGFYQALAAGESIDDAFRLGVIQLRVAPIGSDASAPVLFRLVTGHSR